MGGNDGYRRYIEAATVLGQITRARAEEIVREMMSGGEMQRAQAQQWVDDLIERSRKATEDLFDIIRTEVTNQLGALGLDPDDLARQAADILRRSAEAGRRATQGASPWGSRNTPPGSSAKNAPEPKKGAPPNKAAAKKSGTQKAAAKKAPAAKKAGGPAKKAPSAKKSGTQKAAAKKAPAAKKAGGPAKSAAPGASSTDSGSSTGPARR